MTERGMVDLPGVDAVTSSWVAFETHRRRVDLSATVGQFLASAEAEGVVPLLITPPDAQIGMLLSMALVHAGGVWLLRQDDGSFIDAMLHVRVTDLDEAADRFAAAEREEVRPGDHETNPVAGALGFELLVHHRATEHLRVGALAEAVCSTVGHTMPDLWGSTRPFCKPWDREGITMLARHQMPLSSYIAGSAPDGTTFWLHYERTAFGVTERIRGAAPLGPYRDAVNRSIDLSEELFRRLDDEFVPVAGMTTLVDLEPDLTYAARIRRPEVPRALLIGSWAIKEAGIDVEELAGFPGGIRLGRPAVPTLAFRFDSGDDRPPPWVQLAALYDAIGFENVARTLGWSAGR